MLRPEDKRATTAGPENLLCRPQRVSCLLCFDPQHLIQGKADIAQSKTVRRVRRLNERDGPLVRGAERWSQQPQLPHTRLLDQQVDQRTDRPATTGKFG